MIRIGGPLIDIFSECLWFEVVCPYIVGTVQV